MPAASDARWCRVAAPSRRPSGRSPWESPSASQARGGDRIDQLCLARGVDPSPSGSAPPEPQGRSDTQTVNPIYEPDEEVSASPRHENRGQVHGSKRASPGTAMSRERTSRHQGAVRVAEAQEALHPPAGLDAACEDRRRWPRFLRRSLTTLAPPGLVTLGAVLPVDIPTTTAALVLHPLGRRRHCHGWPGGRTRLLGRSFPGAELLLHTSVHTPSREETADLVAAVFLAVSVTVGTMFSAPSSNARADTRARGAAPQPSGNTPRFRRRTEDVLRSLARSVLELFDLARCEITGKLSRMPGRGREPRPTAT